jgi:hypothetical protein
MELFSAENGTPSRISNYFCIGKRWGMLSGNLMIGCHFGGMLIHTELFGRTRRTFLRAVILENSRRSSGVE